jgi:5'-3' exonuclease
MVDLQLKGLIATDTLHFLFDGPAPLAKYCTQVSRRILGGKSEPSATNVVTPGTSFMSELNSAMLFYLALRASRSPQHSQTRFYLSGISSHCHVFLLLLTFRK